MVMNVPAAGGTRLISSDRGGKNEGGHGDGYL